MLPLPALLSITVLFYSLAVAAVVLLYIFYTKPDGCAEHKLFISLNLILCVIVSIVSVLPKVQVRRPPSFLTDDAELVGVWEIDRVCFRFQEVQPYSGLLQSSFITIYTMYVTWSAMTNNPSK